jgi:hypothetical protein
MAKYDVIKTVECVNNILNEEFVETVGYDKRKEF